MRGWKTVVAGLVTFAFGLGSPSLADESNQCRVGERMYPPDVTICSNGLVVTCQNGTWQNNDGRRCDTPTGSFVGARRPFQHKNDEEIPEYVKEKYPGLDLH